VNTPSPMRPPPIRSREAGSGTLDVVIVGLVLNVTDAEALSVPLGPRPAPPVPVTEGVILKLKLPVVAPLEKVVGVVKVATLSHCKVPVPEQLPNEVREPWPVSENVPLGLGVKACPLYVHVQVI